MVISDFKRSWRVTVAFLAIVTLAGCSQRGLSGERQSVSGKLSLDGKPVEIAVVEFSKNAEQGEVQSVVVRDGRFSLEAASGLPAGQYSVAVLPYVPEIEELGAMPPADKAKVAASGERVPEKYRRRGMLTARIEAGKDNAIVLDMESRPR